MIRVVMREFRDGVIIEDLAWTGVLDRAWEVMFLREAGGAGGGGPDHATIMEIAAAELDRFGARLLVSHADDRVVAEFPDRGSLSWFRMVWS